MRAQRYFFTLLLLLACLLIACGAAATPPIRPAAQPTSAQEETGAIITAAPLPEPTATQPAAPAAIPEARRIVLEWPPVIRSGDSDTVRLTLELDPENHLTPTAEISGHAVRGEPVEVPNLYATHQVLAEARLDIAGLQVSPEGLASQPLLPGRAVTFYWSVYTDKVGNYRGTAWLNLHFIPLDKNDPSQYESQRALSAQQIEIRSANLLGMTGSVARWAGAIGVVVGSTFGLDNVIGWVWGRVRRRRMKAEG